MSSAVQNSRASEAMACCAGKASSSFDAELDPAFADAIREDGMHRQLTLSVPEIHCAACIGAIERAVAAAAPNTCARVNVTRRTVTMTFGGDADAPAKAVGALRDLGYAPQPVGRTDGPVDPVGRQLLRCLAVSGFAAMNVMLLSVAVWAGADGSTAALLNWFAALVALPALAYAARPFLRSAASALGGGRLNMDVPIALAIMLAAGLSLTQTVNGTGEAYFDAAITLTFFLLLGRLLDHQTRARARASIRVLTSMEPAATMRITPDGVTERVPVAAIAIGDLVEVAAGERVPVDGRLQGEATFDASLVTGETRVVQLHDGDEVLAGTLAVDGPVRLSALRQRRDSFVARLTALQSAAEMARSRPARIADQAARIYAPVVHLTALATLLGWLAVGVPLSEALPIAIAVLIITCPCALGLAVPAVQVAACDRLFRLGLAVKDGGVLERLRQVDEVVFDKTGTLTAPSLDPATPLSAEDLALAAALARHSSHPVSRAIVRAAEARELAVPTVRAVRELRGRGVCGVTEHGALVFLGRGGAPWLDTADRSEPERKAEGLALHRAGEPAIPIAVRETVRPGTDVLLGALGEAGMPVAIVSGDAPAAVRSIATELRIERWQASSSPADKVRCLEARRQAGARPLMIGDGINDGPALAVAHASVAPAESADLSRAAADIVLIGHDLSRVADAVAVARRAHRLILGNFAIAAAYNAVAIPLAVAGYATPLLAAIAMSTSSILVTLNALRLRTTTPRLADRRRARATPSLPRASATVEPARPDAAAAA